MEKIVREIKDIEDLIKLITDIPEGTIVEVNLGEEEDDG